MGKKVNKWIKKGRKNCRKGLHWYILSYPDGLVCPICGHKKEEGYMMPEYNCYIVISPEIIPGRVKNEPIH